MGAALYNDYFGFRERPFSLSPDPDFLFWSKAHARAISVLEYGIVTRAPLTLVSGEVGTGKTTLIQQLLRNLENDVTVGLISNARGDRGDLLRWVLGAFDLDVPNDGDYVDLFQRFQDFVLAEYAAGRHVALIVDEAQNLGIDTLEELRMLTNINSGKDELLQIILVGQPELRVMVRKPELRQFAQRVTATYHLEPMDLDTTVNYVIHRLKHAGGTGKEFTLETIRHIYNESEGIPRVVNKLCDLALVYASTAGEKEVGVGTIKELIQDGLILKSSKEPLVLTERIDNVGKAAE
ncbi:ExeA family protein [Shimia aestuarii]|uniref:Type II secretion system protein A n=1 Tax=Shimia aestuarii TaxID=254406 RepID=A0A1I4IQK9_9RHOB|nr:AAA family ATPase [Shimia aestuarii]SFL56273.1 type II secretion system protein A [Shimia aestuarii]